jgi:hypothetical protein
MKLALIQKGIAKYETQKESRFYTINGRVEEPRESGRREGNLAKSLIQN